MPRFSDIRNYFLINKPYYDSTALPVPIALSSHHRKLYWLCKSSKLFSIIPVDIKSGWFRCRWNVNTPKFAMVSTLSSLAAPDVVVTTSGVASLSDDKVGIMVTLYLAYINFSLEQLTSYKGSLCPSPLPVNTHIKAYISLEHQWNTNGWVQSFNHVRISYTWRPRSWPSLCDGVGAK